MAALARRWRSPWELALAQRGNADRIGARAAAERHIEPRGIGATGRSSRIDGLCLAGGAERLSTRQRRKLGVSSGCLRPGARGRSRSEEGADLFRSAKSLSLLCRPIADRGLLAAVAALFLGLGLDA